MVTSNNEIIYLSSPLIFLQKCQEKFFSHIFNYEKTCVKEFTMIISEKLIYRGLHNLMHRNILFLFENIGCLFYLKKKILPHII